MARYQVSLDIEDLYGNSIALLIQSLNLRWSAENGHAPFLLTLHSAGVKNILRRDIIAEGENECHLMMRYTHRVL